MESILRSLQGRGEWQLVGRGKGGNVKELPLLCFVMFSVKLEARSSARSMGSGKDWVRGSRRMVKVVESN